MARIGQLVNTMREARGLTITEFAQRMGMDRRVLRRLETGERPWHLRHIVPAANALGLRPFMLLMSDRERRRARLIFG